MKMLQNFLKVFQQFFKNQYLFARGGGGSRRRGGGGGVIHMREVGREVRLGFRCGSKSWGWLHESQTLEVGLLKIFHKTYV
jgi:hypothetical protein